MCLSILTLAVHSVEGDAAREILVGGNLKLIAYGGPLPEGESAFSSFMTGTMAPGVL